MASRTILRGVLVAALVVVLAGCLRVDVSMDVDDDGSGTIELEMLLKDDALVEFISLIGGDEVAGVSPEIACAAVEGLAPEEITDLPDAIMEPARDGDFCGFKMSRSLAPSLNHTDSLEPFFEPGSSLRKVDDEWILDLRFGQDSIGDLSLADADADPEYQEQMKDARFSITIDLPGVAVEDAHNATTVDGGRFTWEVDLLNPVTLDSPLIARTEPGSGSAFGWQLVATVVGVAIALGLLAAFFLGGEEESPVSEQQLGDAPAPPEPYFDPAFGVWVMDDPMNGRMWHDTKNDRWVRFDDNQTGAGPAH